MPNYKWLPVIKNIFGTFFIDFPDISHQLSSCEHISCQALSRGHPKDWRLITNPSADLKPIRFWRNIFQWQGKPPMYFLPSKSSSGKHRKRRGILVKWSFDLMIFYNQWTIEQMIFELLLLHPLLHHQHFHKISADHRPRLHADMFPVKGLVPITQGNPGRWFGSK